MTFGGRGSGHADLNSLFYVLHFLAQYLVRSLVEIREVTPLSNPLLQAKRKSQTFLISTVFALLFNK